MSIVLVIFLLIIQTALCFGLVWLFKRYFNYFQKPKKVSVKKVEISPVKRHVVKQLPPPTQQYDGVYTPTTREIPVKKSGGYLVQYGMTDEERALIEMFFDED